MTRTRLIMIAWLGLGALLQACAQTTEQDISSGSNWLTCEAIDDCDDGRAVRCSDDGFCLDAQGDRIAAAAAGSDTESSSEPAGSREPSDDGAGGSASSDAGVVAPGGGDQGTTTGTAGSIAPAPTSGYTAACDEPGAREPLVPRAGETCYDFPVHGVSSTDDTTPFMIATGESYNQFYYAVPWPAGSVATSYGVVDDSGLSVHAWAFSVASSFPPGTISPNVTGTLIGESARMFGAWAIGGCNVVMPDDVGLWLPGSGNLVVQWHHYNVSGEMVGDASVFRVCTVPGEERSQLAGITMLGTENLNGPAGMPFGTNQFGSRCLNDSGGPVTVLALDPHMHRLGQQITTSVERVSGDEETILDEPFVFDQRQHYRMAVVLQPGDAIRTRCIYQNTTMYNVAFGQSADQEMCYQFAIATPEVALDNGVISLIGASNTCW